MANHDYLSRQSEPRGGGGAVLLIIAALGLLLLAFAFFSGGGESGPADGAAVPLESAPPAGAEPAPPSE